MKIDRTLRYKAFFALVFMSLSFAVGSLSFPVYADRADVSASYANTHKPTPKPKAKKKTTKKAKKTTKKKTTKVVKKTSSQSAHVYAQLDKKDKADAKKPTKKKTKKATTKAKPKPKATDAFKTTAYSTRRAQQNADSLAVYNAKKKSDAAAKAKKAAAAKKLKQELAAEDARRLSQNKTAISKMTKTQKKSLSKSVAKQKKVNQKTAADKAELYKQTQADVEKRRAMFNVGAQAKWEKDHHVSGKKGDAAYNKYLLSKSKADAKASEKATTNARKKYDAIHGFGTYDAMVAAATKAKTAIDKQQYDDVYGPGTYEKSQKKLKEQLSKASAYDVFHVKTDGKTVFKSKAPAKKNISVGSLPTSSSTGTSGTAGAVVNKNTGNSFTKAAGTAFKYLGIGVDSARGLLDSTAYAVSQWAGRQYNGLVDSAFGVTNSSAAYDTSMSNLNTQLQREKTDLANLQKKQQSGQPLTTAQKNYVKFLTNKNVAAQTANITKNDFQQGWDMVGAGADPQNFAKIADEGYFGGAKVIRKNPIVSTFYSIGAMVATDPLNLLVATSVGSAASKANALAKASDGLKIIEVGAKGAEGFADAAKIAEGLEDGEKAVIVMQKSSGLAKYIGKIPMLGEAVTQSIVVDGSGQAIDIINGIAKGTITDSASAIERMQTAVQAAEKAGEIVSEGAAAAAKDNAGVMRGLYQAAVDGSAQAAADAAKTAAEAAKGTNGYSAALRMSREADGALLAVKSGASTSLVEKAGLTLQRVGNGLLRTPYAISDLGNGIGQLASKAGENTKNFFTALSTSGKTAGTVAETESIVGGSTKTILSVAGETIDSRMADLNAAIKAGNPEAIAETRTALTEAQDLERSISSGESLTKLQLANVNQSHAELLLDEARTSGNAEAIANAEKTVTSAESKVASLEKSEVLATKLEKSKVATESLTEVESQIVDKAEEKAKAQEALDELQKSLEENKSSGVTKSQKAQLNKLQGNVDTASKAIGDLKSQAKALTTIIDENHVSTGEIVWDNIKSAASGVADRLNTVKNNVVTAFGNLRGGSAAAETETAITKATGSLEDVQALNASKVDEAMSGLEKAIKGGDAVEIETARDTLGRFQDVQLEIDKVTTGSEAAKATEKQVQVITETISQTQKELDAARAAGDAEEVAVKTTEVAAEQADLKVAETAKDDLAAEKVADKPVDSVQVSEKNKALGEAQDAAKQRILDKEEEIVRLNREMRTMPVETEADRAALETARGELVQKYAERKDLQTALGDIKATAKATVDAEKDGVIVSSAKKVANTFTDLLDNVKARFFTTSEEAQQIADANAAARAAETATRAEQEARLVEGVAIASSSLEDSTAEVTRLTELKASLEPASATSEVSGSLNDVNRTVKVDDGSYSLERKGQNWFSGRKDLDKMEEGVVKVHVTIQDAEDLGRVQEVLIPALDKTNGDAVLKGIDLNYKTFDPRFGVGLDGYGADLLKPTGIGQGAKGFTIVVETPEDAVKIAERLDQIMQESGLGRDFPIATNNVDTIIGSSNRIGVVTDTMPEILDSKYHVIGTQLEEPVVDKMRDFVHANPGSKLTEEELRTIEESAGIKKGYLTYQTNSYTKEEVLSLKIDAGRMGSRGAYLREGGLQKISGSLTDRGAIYSLYDLLGLDPAGDISGVRMGGLSAAAEAKLNSASSLPTLDEVSSLLAQAEQKQQEVVASAENAKAVLNAHRQESFIGDVQNFFGGLTDKLKVVISTSGPALADDAGFMEVGGTSGDSIRDSVSKFFSDRKAAKAAEALAQVHEGDLGKVSEALSSLAKSQGVDIAAGEAISVDAKSLATIAKDAGYKDSEELIQTVTKYAEAMKTNTPLVELPEQESGTIRAVFGSSNQQMVEGYAENGITAGGGTKLTKFNPEAPLEGIGKDAHIVVVDIPEAESGKYFGLNADGSVNFANKLKVAIPAEYVKLVDNNFEVLQKTILGLSGEGKTAAISAAAQRVEAATALAAKDVETAKTATTSIKAGSYLANSIKNLVNDNLLLTSKNSVFWKWFAGNVAVRTAYALTYNDLHNSVTSKTNSDLATYENALAVTSGSITPDLDLSLVTKTSPAATAKPKDKTKDTATKDNTGTPATTSPNSTDSSPTTSNGDGSSTGSINAVTQTATPTPTVTKSPTPTVTPTPTPAPQTWSDANCGVKYSSIESAGKDSYFEVCGGVKSAQVAGTAINGTVPVVTVFTLNNGVITPGAKVQVELYQGNRAGVTFNSGTITSDKQGRVQLPIYGYKADTYVFKIRVNGQYLSDAAIVVFTQPQTTLQTLFPSLNFNIFSFLKSLMPAVGL